MISRIRAIAIFAAILIAGVLSVAAVRRASFSHGDLRCPNVARQLVIALNSYHATHGELPRHAEFNQDGVAIHCWRTRLIPFLDPVDQLYRWDEPWDGPFNARLARGQSVGVDADFYAIVGEETAWPPNGSQRFDAITDGTQNTILLVESDAVRAYWSEPQDLHLETMSLVVNGTQRAGASCAHRRGPLVVFCDGAIYRLSPNIEAATFRALLTASVGDPVNRDRLIAEVLLSRPQGDR